MFSVVKRLCSIGDRYLGTPGDLASASYITGEYRKMGLDVKTYYLDLVSVPELAKPILSIRSPDSREIEAKTILHSPPTPKDGLEAEVVYLGDGTKADFEKMDVHGKIALVKGSGTIFLEGRLLRSAESGAVAMIEISNRLFGWAAFDCYDPQGEFLPRTIPAVSVSAYDGVKLLGQLIEGRVVARLQVRTNLVLKARTPFVVGTLSGRGNLKEKLVILAHRDTGYSPGANDNASGTAIMLETARLLSRLKPRRDIEFVSTSAEETGSVGTALFVERYPSEVSGAKAVINLDMLATGGDLFLVDKCEFQDKGVLSHSSWLNNAMSRAAKELGYSLRAKSTDWWIGEEARYMLKGVQSSFLTKHGIEDIYYHTDYDLPDKIDPNTMKVAGDIVLKVLHDLGNKKVLPKK